MLANRRAEFPERLDDSFAILRIACIQKRECDDSRAVNVFSKKRQRRRQAYKSPYGEFIRSLCRKFAVLLQDGLRSGHRIDDEAAQHAGADRVESKLEARDDAEIAASSPKRPEEVRMLRLAGAQHFAVR